MIPKISIIIPFYNCRYVDQAIESGLQQMYPNLEIVVVNDGSTLHNDKIVPYLQRIRYMEKKHGGTASALNTGIRSATGDYISWLSSDDLYYPNKLSRQMTFMLAQRASISFTNYDLIDANNNVTQYAATLRFADSIELYHLLTFGCPINGCTVMMKKDLLDKVGLFNEDLAYTHDYDLWQRVVLAGYEFYYLDENLIKYRVHEEMGTKKYADGIPQEIQTTKEKYRLLLTEYVDQLKRRREK